MNHTKFKKAFHRFEEMLRKYRAISTDYDKVLKGAAQDLLVKRFEYTLEMA